MGGQESVVEKLFVPLVVAADMRSFDFVRLRLTMAESDRRD
jgi:hypothetical protein